MTIFFARASPFFFFGHSWRRYFSILLSATESTVVNKSTKVLRALGWGGYDETGAQSQYLRQVDLQFDSAENETCRCPAYYHLFTMVGEERQGTCRGDSGKCIEKLESRIDFFPLAQGVPSSPKRRMEALPWWGFSLVRVWTAPGLVILTTTGRRSQESG